MAGPNIKIPLAVFSVLNVVGILTFVFPMIYYAAEGNALVLIIGVLAHFIMDVSMILT